ncbi:8909_t:CDS:2 [Ambispora leptoticha]|uniref:8909_t:CDS:1 n=1 Tax=Ambispora leptoticha TaxID=144679 RepID=A0A9N8ZB73_9GLOM|nr:8909_t:CDS:2 [Ambispora leptoticha]
MIRGRFVRRHGKYIRKQPETTFGSQETLHSGKANSLNSMLSAVGYNRAFLSFMELPMRKEMASQDTPVKTKIANAPSPHSPIKPTEKTNAHLLITLLGTSDSFSVAYAPIFYSFTFDSFPVAWES